MLGKAVALAIGLSPLLNLFAATPIPQLMATPKPTPTPPSLIANAWGVLLQNQESPPPVNENPNAQRDAFISALRVLAAENEKAPSAVGAQIGAELQELTRQVMASASSSELQKRFLTLQRLYDPRVIDQARVLSQQYRCPMHPDVIGRLGDICPRCGMGVSSLVRLSANSLRPQLLPFTIKAKVETDGPLIVGSELKAHLILTSLHGGQPVTLDQLREVHTQKIHLLLNDGSLVDYHHVHPTPTTIPGRYDFSFTPQKPGPYRLWADIQPIATDIQEFAMALIISDAHAERLLMEPDRLTTIVNGLQYTLSFDRPLKTGDPALGSLHVTELNGKGFDRLEPIMGAFAHIVGFREDRTTALHIHPELARPLLPTDRGGPDLHFRFYAAKPGFYRLFTQVQRNGAQEFANFAVNVAQGPLPPGWEKNNCSSGRSSPVFSYGIRITQITLPERRSRTAYRCENDGDPSRQASRGLYRELEQSDRRQAGVGEQID